MGFKQWLDMITGVEAARNRYLISKQNLEVMRETNKEIYNRFEFVCSLCKDKEQICRCCGDIEGLACDWHRSDHLRCKKCQMIQLPLFGGIQGKLRKEMSSLYYGSKKLGIKEYKTRRDRLIVKLQRVGAI